MRCFHLATCTEPQDGVHEARCNREAPVHEYLPNHVRRGPGRGALASRTKPSPFAHTFLGPSYSHLHSLCHRVYSRSGTASFRTTVAVAVTRSRCSSQSISCAPCTANICNDSTTPLGLLATILLHIHSCAGRLLARSTSPGPTTVLPVTASQSAHQPRTNSFVDRTSKRKLATKLT